MKDDFRDHIGRAQLWRVFYNAEQAPFDQPHHSPVQVSGHFNYTEVNTDLWLSLYYFMTFHSKSTIVASSFHVNKYCIPFTTVPRCKAATLCFKVNNRCFEQSLCGYCTYQFGYRLVQLRKSTRSMALGFPWKPTFQTSDRSNHDSLPTLIAYTTLV